MSNTELINRYEDSGHEEYLDEMTQRNLHTVRSLCESGDFGKARQWIKEREANYVD